MACIEPVWRASSIHFSFFWPKTPIWPVLNSNPRRLPWADHLICFAVRQKADVYWISWHFWNQKSVNLFSTRQSPVVAKRLTEHKDTKARRFTRPKNISRDGKTQSWQRHKLCDFWGYDTFAVTVLLSLCLCVLLIHPKLKLNDYILFTTNCTNCTNYPYDYQGRSLFLDALAPRRDCSRGTCNSCNSWFYKN